MQEARFQSHKMWPDAEDIRPGFLGSRSMQQQTLSDYQSTDDSLPKYKRIAPFVEDNYWSMTAGEIQEEVGCGGSTLRRAIKHLGLPRKTNENKLEHIYGVPVNWLLYTLHNTIGKSVNQMSSELSISRKWISDMMDERGIPRRGQSEAEKLKWSQMTSEEREEQVRAAHEKNRELWRRGEHGMLEWREEHPKEVSRIASKNAKRMSEVREKNGMEGLSGPDHPTWRGGYKHKTRIMKMLPGNSFFSQKQKARERDDHTCQMCGDHMQDIGKAQDVHHIVPVLCGGTNALELLISLCPSCHTTAEHYTKKFTEPILTEYFIEDD